MIGEGGFVRSGRIDFGRVNGAALARAAAVVRGLLPEGRLEGHEYVARNPLRPDRRLGWPRQSLPMGFPRGSRRR